MSNNDEKNILLTADTPPLCRGLTDDQNGGKLCATRHSSISKHTKLHTGSLLPYHAHPTLPVSKLLHPFPIFFYKVFAQETTKKLSKSLINYNEAATVRYICNSTHKENMEEEVKKLIIISP